MAARNKKAADGSDCDRFAAEELTEQAAAFIIRGSTDTARAFLEEALARETGSVRARVCKALAMIQAGDFAAALAMAEKVLEATPDCGTAHVARGYARGKMGDLEGARRDFGRGEECYPDDYRVPYNIACFWGEAGDEEECLRYLERALAIAPPNFSGAVARDPSFAGVRDKSWFRDIVARARERVASKPAP